MFSSAGAWSTDQGCSHLEGNLTVPEPGTPRAHWCSIVEPGHQWWLLAVLPALACFTVIALLSIATRLRTSRVRIGVALLIGVLIYAQAAHVDALHAAYEL